MGFEINKPEISVVTGKNLKHKLTVAYNGDIRIKIAKDSDEDEFNFIIMAFTKVSKSALALRKGTLRGSIKKNSDQHSITLWNDSKKEHYTFNF